MEFYQKEIKEVFKELEGSEKGLNSKEAIGRLKRYGLNQIKEREKLIPLRIFLNQFKDILIWILIIAAIISILLPIYETNGNAKLIDFAEAIAIIFILFSNAILGFMQEYKAEKSIQALRKLSSLKAEVMRDGKKQTIDVIELVPGDIIFIETGDKIPADARLIEAHNLEVQESSLTGESIPVVKHSSVIDHKIQLAEQKNMVFSSTIATRGRGKAVVVETGMSTQIGKIAEIIEEVGEEPTPLQKKLHSFGKFLGLTVIVISIIAFLIGIAQYKQDFINMLIWAISLAVAAVPEGLPVVVTICLAIGIQRMIKKNVLIRKLGSVETLGSITVIASDKTGTLTCNEMTVKRLYVNNEVINVFGEGYSVKGDFSEDIEDARLLLKIGALCNDASLINHEGYGDPTELALIVSAAKAGINKENISKEYVRINEIPFDSERKLMTTIHQYNSKIYAYTKGAPEILIKKCSRIQVNNTIRKIKKSDIEKILEINDSFAAQSLRVLGFAYKQLTTKKAEENDLIFVGLQAMHDSPRKDVKLAIEKCKKAGIKVVMITGDHKTTAISVAKELDIKGAVLTGEDLDQINEIDLNKIVEEVAIYARVNPQHKLRIIDALKKHSHIVAMTGDGVNDAPALKKADIGIAMGITGTDVAKEASDMILVDDNFASIVNAVEEGRIIYDNIKKFLFYMLSTNLSEILIVILGLLFNFPLPLLALQILWINLVSDGLPSLALGANPQEDAIMEHPPKDPKEHILSNEMFTWLIITSIVITLGVLSLFYYYLKLYPDNVVYARTIAFTSLIVFELLNAFLIRSDKKSSFKTDIFSNKWLLIAIISSLILQVLIIYTPISVVFGIVKINIKDWFLIVLVSFSLVIVSELRKFTRRSQNDNKIKI